MTQGVALYGRHSSDLQNPRSTSDQLAALRAAAEARGQRVVAQFIDEGLTGANMLRPGLQELLARAERREFDRVLAEALDRISRDQEGTAHVFKRLTYAGVVLETLSEGVITELHVGLNGTMNQLFLKELAHKTRRGLFGRVKAGFSGGGRCYGYAIVDTGLDGERGVLRVDEAEAEVIRRIFREYVGGASPRAIARALNGEGVRSPRGGEWSGSTISGDRRAGDGLLHQQLLVGVRVFNKRTFRKHPDTGCRTSVLNPPEAWVHQPAPDLRIIDDTLWEAAQARKTELTAAPATYGAKPKRLLSRLMVCGTCGSTMVLGGGKYACSRAREKGTCANTKIIRAEAVEARVLDGVREHLLSPRAIQLAVETVAAQAVAERRAVLEARAPMKRELAEQERRLGRVQDMYVAGQLEMGELKQRSAPLIAARND